MYKIARVVLTTALCAATLAAQDSRGTIVERVTDQSGANVAGADVRAVNVATGVAVIA